MVYRSHLSIEVIVAAPVIADGAVDGGVHIRSLHAQPVQQFRAEMGLAAR